VALAIGREPGSLGATSFPRVSWRIEASNGIYLPQIAWHLDARLPVRRSFVSHAHSDHTAPHELVLCSEGTARLMAARMPGERREIILPFGVEHSLEDGTRLSLHPAGHIFGSAQLRAEHPDRGTLLFTGDFKLRPGRSAEPCATPRADVLIMETTFGRPHYVFPPTQEIVAAIVRFCRNVLDDGETPVLFGYSLGKSQELLGGLAGAGLPIALHPQTWRMTRIYESMGVRFPAYIKYEPGTAAGHVVIAPPQSAQSAWLRKITPRRTAVATGWAMDANAIYRYQCDAAFPLSDHADYPDLMRFVEQVQPSVVYTVHGFTTDFARDLRAKGIEAWSLDADNQLELGLASEHADASKPADASSTVSVTIRGNAEAPAPEFTRPAVDSFLAFAETANAVRDATGKLEKIRLLSAFFAAQPDESLGNAALYFTGRPFSSAAGRALQIGWSVIKRALLAVAPITEAEFRAAYGRTGDAGDATEAVLVGRTQPQTVTLRDVAEFFEAITTTRGPLEKIALLEKLLRRLSALEAKYLVKIITGDLRIGLKEGLVEEAIAVAFQRAPAAVREANMRCGDIAVTALAARQGTLADIALRVFHPLHFMLASPEPDAASILARLGDEVWLEEKYDGIRCQLHKQDSRAELYSRDLRRITDQFPELIRAAANLPHDVVADGELLAWRSGRALPFAELQRRLGRRGDDFFLGAEIPVSLMLYDLLWMDGRILLDAPLRERRAALESLSLPAEFVLAPRTIAHGADEIDAAFLAARARGNEGLMAKDPASPYTPGRRGLAWLKLKRAYATLDVVVVAVEYGHGKRNAVLSDYTFAVRDEDTGTLRTIGKAYSGLTDAEIATMTEHFLAQTIEVHGRVRRVVPDTVIEVAFDTIQASDRHDSGFALRFPRIARIRTDKTPEQIDTMATCRKLAAAALSADAQLAIRETTA
jgi:DNA ligase 1